ncbi:lipoprotein NlpI [Ferrimonas senticii]|uniref:lipoprotein NlpI n=1 Tax=Ferrimonas senticii TaxID=394566 RepID=UPI00041185DF|nr:lipoprotein NlpI [Ferrimonas senticii]
MTSKRLGLPLMLALALLNGCATTAVDTVAEPSGQLLLATPRQADAQLQMHVAKITELLGNNQLTEQQRAQLYYDRGIRYDSLGLRGLARIDFNAAMQLQPANANLFNFMGIYATQAAEFDSAFESFDAVLELSPDYDFAYLNRGIASYYGDRPALAISDFDTFYLLDKRDPYRVIWLYLAEYQQDPLTAAGKLQARMAGLDTSQWGYQLARFFAGEIDRSQLLASTREGLTKQGQLAERLCEAYFYLGKQARLDGEPTQAINLYKLALSTNIYEFVEHRYSLLEMRLIAEEAIEQAREAQQTDSEL